MAEKASEPTQQRQPFKVQHVRGRGSSPEPGLAKAHEMLLDDGQGKSLRISRLEHENYRKVDQIIPIAEILPNRHFDRCPLCLASDADSLEHVPPKALGGAVMVNTCARCNNAFGSKLEADLVDWWEDALVRVEYRSPRFQGARRGPKILLRQTDNGEFVMLPDKPRTPGEVREVFEEGGEIDFTYQVIDSVRWQLAALKSAYLASCLLLGKIPETPEAERVRESLMIARDKPKNERLDPMLVPQGIRVARSQGPAARGETLLVQAWSDDHAEYAVLLSAVLLVTWPVGGWVVPVVDDKPGAAVQLGPHLADS
ncbi:HNH endonuclease [Aeromicrobium sp. PE09-221]|uniref:HNH endonuclease n=1 Tax=Aeromicrobium sp. PE09-221 TaxID=1898043 RepID=UPI00111DBFB9|nr:HNH endonuclease [Aeromicrobium sp. PE09-221]